VPSIEVDLSMWNRTLNWLESLADPEKTNSKTNVADGEHEYRTADEAIVAGWMDAAGEQKPPKKRDQQELLKLLKLRNRWRWNRLRHDLHWAQKVAESQGYNPEMVTWLLREK
jgi:hypothetical protein